MALRLPSRMEVMHCLVWILYFLTLAQALEVICSQYFRDPNKKTAYCMDIGQNITMYNAVALWIIQCCNGTSGIAPSLFKNFFKTSNSYPCDSDNPVVSATVSRQLYGTVQREFEQCIKDYLAHPCSLPPMPTPSHAPKHHHEGTSHAGLTWGLSISLTCSIPVSCLLLFALYKFRQQITAGIRRTLHNPRSDFSPL